MITDMKNHRIVQWIKEGKVFIYPTDTIYGIGCDATNEDAVKRIREIKGSQKKFSVIAPGKEWIKDNCESGKELGKLPGPFTFIYKTTAKVACNYNSDTIGVRIPSHEFSKYVEEAGVPFVTTSVNETGEKPAFSIEYIPENIKSKVDVIVDVETIQGKPSKVVDYTGESPKILRE